MKKLLALLLTGLLLIGFGVGASAETPEELEAEGRALLVQTMEDLRGDYTFSLRKTYNTSDEVVYSNGNFAFTDYAEGIRELHLDGYTYRIYLNRNIYLKNVSSSNVHYIRMLEPRVITEDTPISVSRSSSGLEVYCDGLRYWYRADTLYCISDDTHLYISNFRKSADLSVFSLEGLREVTAEKVNQWNRYDAYWKGFPSALRNVFSLSNFFSEIYGIPMYPFDLLQFFVYLIRLPEMIGLSLYLLLFPY